MKRILCILFLISTLLALSACGSPEPQPTESLEPTPAPSPVDTEPPAVDTDPPLTYEFTNPLTGEPTEEDLSKNRPIAIMLNNLKKALPQCGVSMADIIYEVPAEGGITRMLGVFQSVEGVDYIGSVRSARPYYAALAQGLDAVFLHAGGSPDAYTYIKQNGVTALDCVNGPYEGSLFWRDKDRAKSAGKEHSVFTSGPVITELFEGYTFRKEHEEGYSYPQTFAGDGTPAGGESAQTVTVSFSDYKTGVFRYDAGLGAYLVEEYGAPYKDGNTGEQVAVTNVLVLQTTTKVLDSEGRLSVGLDSGSGWFACGGKAVPIRWSKGKGSNPLTYTTEDGKDLVLGQGHSYVNILSSTCSVVFE